MTMLNIISVNTRGLNSKEKRDKFYRWIIDSKLNVILIQETHFVGGKCFAIRMWLE